MRRAVTIRAGIQDGELLDHLAKHDLTTVTGTSSVSTANTFWGRAELTSQRVLASLGGLQGVVTGF